MKLYQHIRYFFYVASKWDLKLGFFTFYHELKGEKKYGINTTSFNNLSGLRITGNQLVHATVYMPVNYFTIEKLFSYLPDIARTGTFLDIGSGKGRAMCVAAHYGFGKVSGIDFAKELIDEAEKNLRKTGRKFPGLEYTLHWKDISTLEIGKDTSTVFMFNPFDEILMKIAVQKIVLSLKNNPRPFFVLYASPRHEELFFAKGFDVIYRVKKFNYAEAVILSYTGYVEMKQ